MSHCFPYRVELPDKPVSRNEYRLWAEKRIAMSVWCSQVIVDHWGSDDTAFLFSFEEDMKKFKEHFGI